MVRRWRSHNICHLDCNTMNTSVYVKWLTCKQFGCPIRSIRPACQRCCRDPHQLTNVAVLAAGAAFVVWLQLKEHNIHVPVSQRVSTNSPMYLYTYSAGKLTALHLWRLRTAAVTACKLIPDPLAKATIWKWRGRELPAEKYSVMLMHFPMHFPMVTRLLCELAGHSQETIFFLEFSMCHFREFMHAFILRSFSNPQKNKHSKLSVAHSRLPFHKVDGCMSCVPSGSVAAANIYSVPREVSHVATNSTYGVNLQHYILTS